MVEFNDVRGRNITQMNFEVRVRPDVVKFLEDLDQVTKDRLKSGLKSLERDPFKSRSRSRIKKLRGTKNRDDLYRLKIGDYRAIYAVEEYTVLVLEIIHREKGYDWL
ncbi:MAG: type II toxin-antitoxin system RelE family toxin [Methanosarcinaceae archaeon]